MSLGAKQEEFAHALGKLIIYIESLGLRARLAHGMRCEDCSVGNKNSVHKLKLAQDILIYPDGSTILNSKGYGKLHDYWDTLGGAPRIEEDLNHFSFAWKGRW